MFVELCEQMDALDPPLSVGDGLQVAQSWHMAPASRIAHLYVAPPRTSRMENPKSEI
jgi:hypothetical protein